MEITDFRKHAHKEICVPCLKGKHARDTIPKETYSENHGILYRVSSDLCGPMKIQMPHGEKYFLMFIDGYSHYVKVKLLWLKSNTYSAVKTLVERAEVETGKHINFFQSDGGGEYGSNEFAAYFESNCRHPHKAAITGKAQALYGVYGTISHVAHLSGHVEKHMSYSMFLFFNPAEHGIT